MDMNVYRCSGLMCSEFKIEVIEIADGITEWEQYLCNTLSKASVCILCLWLSCVSELSAIYVGEKYFITVVKWSTIGLGLYLVENPVGTPHVAN